MSEDATIRHLAALLEPPRALSRARRLLERYVDPARLRRAPRRELLAAGLLSAGELRRLEAAFSLTVEALSTPPPRSLTSPDRVAASIPSLWTARSEEVWVLPVDSGLRPLARALVARGGAAACAVRATDVLRPAVAQAAQGFFVVHNHPSGDPSPSSADLRFTTEISSRARDLELQLFDHVVVGGLRWASCVSGERGVIRDPTRRPSGGWSRAARRLSRSAPGHARGRS